MYTVNLFKSYLFRKICLTTRINRTNQPRNTDIPLYQSYEMLHQNIASYKGRVLIIIILMNVIVVVLYQYMLHYGTMTIKISEFVLTQKKNVTFYVSQKYTLELHITTSTNSITSVAFEDDEEDKVNFAINDDLNLRIVAPHRIRTLPYNASIITKRRTANNNNTSTPYIPKAFQIPLGTKYRYTINNETACNKNGTKLTLLIAVMSSMKNVHVREAIRDTWGGYAKSLGIPLLFFLGGTRSSEVQALVSEENDNRRDIVQQDFDDNYYNLSIKTVTMLKWVMEYCAGVSYVLKSDDDMFVNIDAMLDSVRNLNQSGCIHGLLAHDWRPIRHRKSKWFVPEEIFPDEFFPDFVTGPAYIISGDAIPKLYKTALRTRPMYLEDVYVTGIVADAANVSRIHQPGMHNNRRSLHPCTLKHVLTSHSHPAWQIRKIWKVLNLKTFVCLTNITTFANITVTAYDNF